MSPGYVAPPPIFEELPDTGVSASGQPRRASNAAPTSIARRQAGRW
ncbi:hypothetical protein [Nonomuraea rosea]